MHALVTGAAGFVGSHLAEALLARGDTVVGVDCFTPYYDRIDKEQNVASAFAHDDFELVEADLRTTDIDALLTSFGLTREQLADGNKVAAAVRHMAAKMPTYITLKDVKKRWGHGQEDVFPVAQFEKLWGDMTALPECTSVFASVPRARGQQLKGQAQLDGWVRDGSAAHLESLCAWE